MHANVRSNVVALHRCGSARVPLASQVEVVGALPANMTLTDVVLILMLDNHSHFSSLGIINDKTTYVERLSSIEALVALVPTASEVVILGGVAGCIG